MVSNNLILLEKIFIGFKDNAQIRNRKNHFNFQIYRFVVIELWNFYGNILISVRY